MKGVSAALSASRRLAHEAASTRWISLPPRGAARSGAPNPPQGGRRPASSRPFSPAARAMSSRSGGDGRNGEGINGAAMGLPRAEAKRVILEAAKTLQELAGRIGDSFDRAVSLIESVPPGGRVVLTGVGKSGHVARKIAASMSSTGTCAFFMHATEALHGDLGSVRKGDVCIAISYSGETPETLAALEGFRKLSAGSIAITSDPESTLGRLSDVCLAMGSITELDHNKLAPTASTVAAMSLGDALTVVVSNRRNFSRSDFDLYHPGGQLGIQNRLVLQAAERLGSVREHANGSQAGLRNGSQGTAEEEVVSNSTK